MYRTTSVTAVDDHTWVAFVDVHCTFNELEIAGHGHLYEFLFTPGLPVIQSYTYSKSISSLVFMTIFTFNSLIVCYISSVYYTFVELSFVRIYRKVKNQ